MDFEIDTPRSAASAFEGRVVVESMLAALRCIHTADCADLEASVRVGTPQLPQVVSMRLPRRQQPVVRRVPVQWRLSPISVRRSHHVVQVLLCGAVHSAPGRLAVVVALLLSVSLSLSLSLSVSVVHLPVPLLRCRRSQG